MEDNKIETDLFKNVRYYAVGDLDQETTDCLTNGKAKHDIHLAGLTTHAIVADPTHYELDEVEEVWQIPSVDQLWVKLSNLCNTLLPTAAFSPKEKIFHNVVACFSQLSKQDKASMWSLITFHGGRCQATLNHHCTHLVIANPHGAKYDEATKHVSIKIVAPDWVIDSVKMKEEQPPAKYHPMLNIVPSPVQDEIMTSETEVTLPDLEAMSVSDQPQSFMEEEGKEKEAESAQVAVTVITEAQAELIKSSSIISTTAEIVSSASQPEFIQVKQPIVSSRPVVPTASSANMRFSIPTGGNLRSPVPNVSMMGQPFPIPSPSQQVFAGFPPNHISSVMSPDHPLMSPSSSYATSVMSPPPRPGSSPRRGSGHQSSSSKKKKGSHGPRAPMSPHSNIRQIHPMGQQFQGHPQGMMATQQQQQQQMMQKARFPPGMEQSGVMPGQMVNEGTMVGIPDQRFGGFPRRFMNPAMMGQQDNAQHFHHQQQLMQLRQQQQQQMQRMAMLRQGQPNGPGAINQPEVIHAKWPRQPMENNTFPMDQQGQQTYPTVAQQLPNSSVAQSSMIRPSSQSPMSQHGGPVLPISGPQNITQPHQHYSHSISNRFPGQISPQQQQQQQQLMYQQMYQQHLQRSPGPARFPTSTSLEAAGMSGISPLALQQGLQNVAQVDKPALIHPSLQGTLFPRVVTSAQSTSSASTPKKKSKSKRKTDVDEEGKTKPRQRSKSKKSSTPSVSASPAMPTHFHQVQMQPGPSLQPKFHPEVVPTSIQRSSAAYPGMLPAAQTPVLQQTPSSQPFQIKTQPQHMPAQSPVQQMITSHIPAQQITPHQFNAAPPTSLSSAPEQMTFSSQSTIDLHPTVKKEASPVEKPKPEEEVIPSRNFIDPLTHTIKELDLLYKTRDPADSVPPHCFLLGCIFYVCEYDEIVSDVSVIELWKKMIEKYGGIVENHYTAACTHVVCVSCANPVFRQAIAEGKRCVTVYWLNDILLQRELRIPWLALHLPTLFSHKNKPAVNQTLTYTGFHAKERERLKMMGFVCGAKFTGFLTRGHTALICKGEGSLKLEKAKSWSIPCLSTAWLRDLMQCEDSSSVTTQDVKYSKYDETETINGFALDVAKSQTLLNAWKNFIPITQDCLLRAHIKRKMEPVPSLPKRPKPNEQLQLLPRVCFTGLLPVVVHDLKQKLEALEGRHENTFALCTHLVASNVARTVKFLSCISSCQYVVTPEWIEDSYKNNWFLDEENYLLVDKRAEERLHFSLQTSIKRANKSPLFKDCLFCITNKVIPDKKTLKQIIECAGGRILYKIPSLSVLKHMKSRMSPNNRIFIVSCPDDEDVYKPLKKEGLFIHNPELILTGVLKQEINTEAYRL